MVSVRMTGCARVVKAFVARAPRSEFREGAAVLAELLESSASGLPAGSEKVVVFNTGSAYKYAEIPERMAEGSY